MADTKISAMTAAALPLTGAELVPIVQSGDNKKTTVADILAYSRSYGAWSDSTDQTGNISAGTVVTFNTIDVADGITLVNNTEITVPDTGVYNLQFSIQFKNVDNAQHDATVWLKINGSDLANSATQYTIPARKSAGIFGYNVAALTFLLSLNSADYVEIYWVPTSTNVTIEHLPANVSPVIPAIPSIIASMIQVS
jgi:hypothetical protein